MTLFRPSPAAALAAISACLLAAAPARAGRDLAPAAFARISSGVVLVRTFDCAGNPRSTGSGFLVGSSVVMTARHVADAAGHPADACTIRVRVGGAWVQVASWLWWKSGADTQGKTIDLATLKLPSAQRGYVFSIASVAPRVGTSIAMIGHPLGNDISLTQGRILDRGTVRSVPELAVNLLGAEGASGSAFVDDSGAVVGILQKGLAGKDVLGEATSGVVIGLDLPTWWKGGARHDLCRTYPGGGIPGCGGRAAEPGVSAAGSRPVHVAGLTPDGWGQTAVGAAAALRARYPDARSVRCGGAVMGGHEPDSSWLVGGARFWDKLVCDVAVAAGGGLSLIFDAKGGAAAAYRVYRVRRSSP